jgi:hypothetical protein
MNNNEEAVGNSKRYINFSDGKLNKNACPYLQQKIGSSCPFLNGSTDKPTTSCPYLSNDSICPYLNNENQKEDCPYLNKSSKEGTDSKEIRKTIKMNST